MRKLLSGILIAFAVSALCAVSASAVNYKIYSDAGLGTNISIQEWNGGSTLTELSDSNGCPFDASKYFRIVWNGGTGWDVWAFASSTPVDLSSYSYLILYVKGAAGGEGFNVCMLDSSSNKAELAIPVTVTKNWQMVKIPLSSFKSANSYLTLTSISDPIYFDFGTSFAETVYVDYFFVGNDATPPGAPTLSSPADGSSTPNQTPLLDWSDVSDDSGVDYEVQVDSHGPAMPSAEVDVSSISASQYTPSISLSYGQYWWRVKTTDGSGNIGVWSSTATFTVAAVETSSPAVPSPVSPANGSSSYDTTPTPAWTQVTDASGVTYRIQIDNTIAFSSPLTVSGIPSNIYSVSPALAADKTYYWRVEAINGVGNQSGYSSYSSFSIVSTTWTSFNVMDDQDAAGYVGTYSASGASLAFGVDYTTFTEGNHSNRTDFGITSAQWAGWFVQEGGAASNATRYMVTYSSGYLAFSFKSSVDVQIGIRSNNVASGNETSKLYLGRDLGVLLNNQWQDVSIPISTFTALDSNLDLSTMTVYFNAAVVGAETGAASGSFWIDNVRWKSPGAVSPDALKVLNGLVNKQSATTGLVRSYETLNWAVTYDQALAIMNFCYYGNLTAAQNVLNAYKNNIGWAGVGGYADEYNVDNWSVIIGTRTTGPNLWMLQAIIYYRYMTGDTTYDTMMNTLAAWLAARQDSDGGLFFGYDGSSWLTYKGTEHNLTAYAVFKNYAQITGNSAYSTKADNVKSWLNTMWGYWNGEPVRRFKVASTSAEIDKALDCYSLAVLAFSTGTYNECLNGVDGYFRNTKTCDLTGAPVDGYDFGGPAGAQPDLDTVWLEGTNQMAEAYSVSGDNTHWAYFTSQAENAIATMGSNSEGIGYATNQGTAYYGWLMDSTHQCVSSAAWYLFAKNKYNPLYPIPIFQVSIHNRLDDSTTTYLSWTTPTLPHSGWIAANQYIKIDCVPNVYGWGIQIYTDNKASNANPKYTGTGNPVGLISSTTTITLPLAWRCVNVTTNTLTVQRGAPSYPDRLWVSEIGNQYPCFIWMEDKNTTGFVNDNDYIIAWDARGIQQAESSWSGTGAISPNYIYLAADFTNALTPNVYTTNKLTVELFHD